MLSGCIFILYSQNKTGALRPPFCRVERKRYRCRSLVSNCQFPFSAALGTVTASVQAASIGIN